MTEPINGTGVNQADYLKLFMQELTYQDPLKPVDNREFMAQMAQFSLLQEAKSANESLIKLLEMQSANQCLALLGKKVLIKDADGEAMVTKVSFSDSEPPKLTVILKNNEVSHIELRHIMEVLN